MKMKKILVLMLAFTLILTAGCGKSAKNTESSLKDEAELSSEINANNTSDENVKEEETASETIPEQKKEPENEPEKEEKEGPSYIGGKEIIVYFPNWKLGRENGNVEDIPWKSVTMVNHAFWEIAPVDDPSETSFERRNARKEARTEYIIKSTLPENDEVIFEKYKEYHDRFPDVKIMLSIGGWSRCGYFSEMAYTEVGRKSFVKACVDLLKENDFLAGIDIDWEYPSGSNDGERKPEGEGDQGCPIYGTSLEDRINFPALLKDLREGLDSEFGQGTKLLTACASSSTGWTLPNQDWYAASPYLDYINIMTYDMAGDWDKQPGHASSVSGSKSAMAYFINAGVDKTKLNLGIPYYGTGFKLAESTKNPNGAKIIVPNGISKDFLTIPQIKIFESEAVDIDNIGWHKGYNDKVGGAYLWNDDPESEYYNWYISYECLDAICGKYALIEKYKLAGVLVWEITEDTLDHEYTKYLADTLK